MPDEELEQIESIYGQLELVRQERMDLLPQHGSLIEVIADAMNALEVAWVQIRLAARDNARAPQGATFVPVSNPKDAKKL